jgi:hypothetical protein
MPQPTIDPRTQTEVDPTVYAAYVKTFVNPTPTFFGKGFKVVAGSSPTWPIEPAFWTLVGVTKT